MPEILFTMIRVYLLVVPFGQILRIPTSVPGLAIHLSDLVVTIIALAGVIFWIPRRACLPRLPLAIPVAGFAIISLVALLLAPDVEIRQTLVGSGYWLRWVAYAHLYFLIAWFMHQPTADSYRQALLRTLLFSGLTLAAFGFVQYLFFPNLNPIHSWGWDLHFYRLTGPVLDPGFMGLLLVFTLITVIYSDFLAPRLVNSAALLIYTAISLTYSRATYVALSAAAVLFIILEKSRRAFYIFLVLVVLTVFLLPQPSGEGGNLARTSTVNFRLVNWQQSWQVIRDHPVLGVGFNLYRYAQARYGFLSPLESETSHSAAGVDNSLLFVLATTGIAGLAAYLGIWFASFQALLPGLHQSPIQRVALLVTVSALIHSQFHNTLFYPPIMGWTWIVLGLAIPGSGLLPKEYKSR